jgi:steroid 5-alpha reductase family enzyme
MRKLLSTGALVAARVYLASFLFYRVLHEGKDGRFDKIRTNRVRFAVAWFLQGVWVFAVSLPTLLTNASKRNVPMNALGYAAVALFATGLALEMTADWQRMQFKSDPANEGRFMSSGVWAYSRHPNYLGEIMLTTGLYLLSLPLLRGMGHLAVLSPILTAFLLLRVSGVPLSEAYWKKKYGDAPEFREYMANTAMLVPFIY